jgi:hypothetical protein
MGIHQEHVERQLVDEAPVPFLEQVDIIAEMQDTGDLPGPDAGGDQVDPPLSGDLQGPGHVACRTGDLAAAPEEIVQGVSGIARIQTEEHVDARRLEVRIDHGDAPALLGHQAGQAGGGVRFSGSAAEGVNGDDLGHGAASLWFRTNGTRVRRCRSLAQHCPEVAFPQKGRPTSLLLRVYRNPPAECKPNQS